MVSLTLLTTCLQLFPIVFITFLPRGPEDMKKLIHGQRSVIGGGLFLAVVFGSIVWVVSNGVLNIEYPGWAGES